MPTRQLRIRNPVIFICDLQEKFRHVIFEFSGVLSTTQKLLRAAQELQIPLVATTQTRAKLGETCSELDLDVRYRTIVHADKTAFSMWVPEVISAVNDLPASHEPNASESDSNFTVKDIVIVGIETHICVLQTVLDAISFGHRVWVVKDGVSSINAEERDIALERCRQEGAKITTSESVIYECLHDAKNNAFKAIFNIVKETNNSTKENLQRLCKF